MKIFTFYVIEYEKSYSSSGSIPRHIYFFPNDLAHISVLIQRWEKKSIDEDVRMRAWLTPGRHNIWLQNRGKLEHKLFRNWATTDCSPLYPVHPRRRRRRAKSRPINSNESKGPIHVLIFCGTADTSETTLKSVDGVKQSDMKTCRDVPTMDRDGTSDACEICTVHYNEGGTYPLRSSSYLLLHRGLRNPKLPNGVNIRSDC